MFLLKKSTFLIILLLLRSFPVHADWVTDAACWGIFAGTLTCKAAQNDEAARNAQRAADEARAAAEKAAAEADAQRRAEAHAAWLKKMEELGRAKSLAEAEQRIKEQYEADRQREQQERDAAAALEQKKQAIEREKQDKINAYKKDRKDMLSQAGTMLIDGSKEIENAPAKLAADTAAFGDLEQSLDDPLAKRFQEAIAKTATATQKVRAQREDLKIKGRELNKIAPKTYASLMAAFDALEKSLIKLVNKDEAGACKTGVLCDLLATAKKSKQNVATTRATINDFITKTSEKIKEKISCIHCPGGNAFPCPLPERMYNTGSWLLNVNPWSE